jgi:hypothetical protein
MSMRPLPLWERATQRLNEEEWVRGYSRSHETPHPIEFVDIPALPSPTRGEGAVTATSLAG